MKTDWIAILALSFLVVVWGSAFGLTAVALEGFSPVEVSFGRTGLAAIVVALVAVASGQGLPDTLAEWRWLALLGIVGLAAPVTVLSWAQLSVPSSVAAIFISSVPLFILLLARLVLKEPVSRRKWLGFAVGFAGLLWLAGPSALRQIGAGGQTLGQAALVLTALGYATGAIVIKLMPEIPPFRATAGTMISGTLFLAPFGFSAIGTAAQVPWPVLLSLLALGIFPSGIGQLIRYFTVRRRGPVFVSVVGYLLPIWAGLVGFFLLDEPLTLHTVSAYGIVLAGILIARDRA